MAPHREFKYDVIQLLDAIRDRPALWDKTLEVYKDKMERKNAWEEICNILEARYEQMSWEEKKRTGEHIMNKWTNIRDTFVKSLKNRHGGRPKKKYLLYNNLKFLIKVIPEDENEGYNSSEISEEPTTYMKQELDEGPSSSFVPRKKIRANSDDDYVPKRSKRDSVNVKSQGSSQDSDYETFDPGNIDFVEVDSKVESDPRVMNEDEAFFASLLPTIVRYNEDERLEFRIEVLAVMKKIKDKRKFHNV